VASTFWKKYWPKRLSIKFKDFSSILTSFVGSRYVKDNLTDQCLKYILVEEEEEDVDEEERVFIERFGSLINWFGPLIDGNKAILDRLTAAMQSEWFHGDISRKEATALLVQQGSFLVRLNMGEKESNYDFPFTISRMNKNGAIDHIRVGREGEKLFIDLKTKENVRRVEGNLINDIINELQGGLNLKEPAPGRKYFKLVKSTGAYEPDSSSGEEKDKNILNDSDKNDSDKDN